MELDSLNLAVTEKVAPDASFMFDSEYVSIAPVRMLAMSANSVMVVFALVVPHTLQSSSRRSFLVIEAFDRNPSVQK